VGAVSNAPDQSPVRLSVNVDHVATVRQARRAIYPDPVEAARLAEAAGASGITVHLRADRRHIQDHDVERLLPVVAGKLNLEMAAEPEMLEVALRIRPHQVTLVPESPTEVTTEGGLDLCLHGDRVREATERLAAAGIAVSIFLDPDPEQIEPLAALRKIGVSGFEINTDAYTKATPGPAREAELQRVARSGALGRAAGLHLYAGHGLTVENVGPIAAIEGMEELNIGHALVSRAVLIGMAAAVEEMLGAMGAGG
jgi:pyridoxine 5-phosphate synthase